MIYDNFFSQIISRILERNLGRTGRGRGIGRDRKVFRMGRECTCSRLLDPAGGRRNRYGEIDIAVDLDLDRLACGRYLVFVLRQHDRRCLSRLIDRHGFSASPAANRNPAFPFLLAAVGCDIEYQP